MTEGADSKRTPKGELARQRILESALQLFGSRGYEETTMREIAAEAGNNMAALRNARPTKMSPMTAMERTCNTCEDHAA